ncbi:hypothetical protein GCM10018952_43010 [Streptosporangium vulgare]
MTQDTAHASLTGGNLPLEPNGFVGREADVEELTDLLGVARVVTLCGAGGIGKSRLAVRVASQVAGEFPGGVWLVELADAVRGDQIEPRVAAVLGVKAEPSRALADTLIDALGDRRLLLVMDNCESLIEESARFCRAVLNVCPDVRVLTTSREPLRVAGETVWRVPPLTLPRSDGHDLGTSEAVRLFLGTSEAVRLFADRATAASRAFSVTEQNAADIAGLCEALDGMPLAIELAAALCRVLTVEQINARIRDRFRLLSAGDRTAPARQQTLRATVDWSYQQLNEPERILLRRLAVFTGGWTLDMAEQVCAGNALWAEDVLGVLCDLVDKSLVLADAEVAGETRYRMLETIREYAIEQLDASGEEAEFRRLHRDHMIEVAARIPPDDRPVPPPGLVRDLPDAGHAGRAPGQRVGGGALVGRVRGRPRERAAPPGPAALADHRRGKVHPGRQVARPPARRRPRGADAVRARRRARAARAGRLRAGRPRHRADRLRRRGRPVPRGGPVRTAQRRARHPRLGRHLPATSRAGQVPAGRGAGGRAHGRRPLARDGHPVHGGHVRAVRGQGEGVAAVLRGRARHRPRSRQTTGPRRSPSSASPRSPGSAATWRRPAPTTSAPSTCSRTSPPTGRPSPACRGWAGSRWPRETSPPPGAG